MNETLWRLSVRCVCVQLRVCSSHSVALMHTAVVPSFALLPVSLFPVYLAVICFTKKKKKSVIVWDDRRIISSSLITDVLTQATHCSTCASLWNLLRCINRNKQQQCAVLNMSAMRRSYLMLGDFPQAEFTKMPETGRVSMQHPSFYNVKCHVVY